VKILSMNIAHGRGPILHQGVLSQRIILSWMRKIAEFLRNSDLDIVGLQEIDQDSHWNGNVDLLEFLRREADFPYSAYGMHNRHQGKRMRFNYGNGFLSRHPIIEDETIGFDSKRIGSKGFLHIQVDSPLGQLDLINLHLDFKSRKQRLIQAHRVKLFLLEKELKRGAEETLQPIVMGDFNARMGNDKDATRFLLEELSAHESYHAYPFKAATFPSYLPRKRIDYIMVPGHLHVSHSEVLRRRLSDHRPVLVDIEEPEK